MICEDRSLVLAAVLQGQISSDWVTLEELEELRVRAEETVMCRNLDLAELRGCSVFGGCECDTVH